MTRPLPHLELVPLLAGCTARRARLLPRTRAILERADYDSLARDLADRRLLPLIGTRALDAAPDLVPQEFAEAVSRARASARARGLAIEAATARVAAALARDGVRALPLKGALLAAEAHGDIGLRETSDIDLLVAAERIDDAVGILCDGLGYSRPHDVRRPNGLPDLHYELHHGSLPAIDLHWRVQWYEHAFSEGMLAAAEPAADGLLRAQPADLIASLLLFHARDGFHGVRVPADLAAWWDRHGDSLPARALEPIAAGHPSIASALTAAAVVVERLTGVPAVGWLGAAAAAGRRIATAVRFADWDQTGDRDQLRANISLVGGLLAPPGSLPEFLRRELTVPGGPAAASAEHAVKVSARYLIGLWKVRGGRTWVVGQPG